MPQAIIPGASQERKRGLGAWSWYAQNLTHLRRGRTGAAAAGHSGPTHKGLQWIPLEVKASTARAFVIKRMGHAVVTPGGKERAADNWQKS